METDFLNFRDGEHFSSGLYQNDILDDSQSSLLDIVAEEYSRNDSIWEEDVEQEINGDVAVIPMCGRLDTFPKLSNSPPARDLHRIFSDWQEHIASIEVPSPEDLPVHQSLVADMLECFNACTEEINPNSIKTEPTFTIESSTHKGKSFDKPIPKSKPPVIGGKNLELLKKVVHNDIKLEDDEEDKNLHIKTEVDIENEEEKHVDEFENLDNFDLTQYINPEADLLCDSSFLKQTIKKENIEQTPVVSTSNEEYEETTIIPQKSCEEIEIKIPKIEPKTDVESSEDEDCIDVVTVPEQMPVLEACDLTSLLEQFEASEAMNPKSKKSENPDVQKQDKVKPSIKELQKLPSPPPPEPEQNSKNKLRIEKKNRQKLVIKTDKVPTKLLQKLKAQTPKKSISLIPAMPSKKPRPRNTSIEKQKPSKGNNFTQENVLFEHDYCGNWSQTKKPSESNQNDAKPDKKPKSNFDFNTIPNEILTIGSKNEIITSICTKPEVVQSFCSNVEKFSSKNIDSYTKNDDGKETIQIDTKIRKIQNLDLKKSRKVLDDTAIRIKYAINNLSQETILKNQPIVKNADGKLMISLLKTNNRLLTANHNKAPNTPNQTTTDEKQQNLTCNNTQTSKKRKLNLEEYKKLRGDVKILQSCEHSRNNSPLSSGANSPNVQNEKEKLLEENYREIMNKMASEILKTNVKTKPLNLELKLEEFVPPDIKVENTEKVDKTPTVEQPEEKLNKPNEKFKMITIVSIGTNTDISYTVNNKPEKIQPEVDKTKLTEIIKPILKTASSKINSNSLITNITETLLQKSPNIELIQTTNLLENSLKPTEQSNKTLSSKFENLSVKLAQIVTKNGKLIPKSESVLKNDIFISKQNQSFVKSEKQVSIIKTENVSKSGQNSNKLVEVHNENVEIHGKIDGNAKNCDGSENGKNINNGDKILELNHNDGVVDNCDKPNKYGVKDVEEHGEDKTVIVIDKDTEKPIKKDVQTQTDDFVINTDCLSKDFRYRRTSSECSSSSGSSVSMKIKKNCRSNHNSSSNSVSSSLEFRYSRSRSRSKSRSISPSDCSVYSELSDSSRSRSRSITPTRWHTNRNSRSRKRVYRAGIRYRSKTYRKGFKMSRSYSRSRSRRRRERENAEERVREVEERRVIYVGKISDNTTKADLRRRFQSFGPITNVSVHFRDHGDNYGFVTFAYKIDAYEAVERGNDDPNFPKYDISFGGRRAFCKTQYSDLDNIEAEELNPTPIFRKEEDTFDILLREVQAKLLKRKF